MGNTVKDMVVKAWQTFKRLTKLGFPTHELLYLFLSLTAPFSPAQAFFALGSALGHTGTPLSPAR